MRAFFAPLVISLAALACSSSSEDAGTPDSDVCANDADCASVPQLCASDVDCPTADLCDHGGTCLPECSTFHPSCPTGSYCDIGTCLGAHGCNPPPPGVVCSMICYAVCRPGAGPDDGGIDPTSSASSTADAGQD